MDHLEPEKQASDHTGGQTRVRTGEFYPEDVREVLGSFLPEARRSGDFFIEPSPGGNINDTYFAGSGGERVLVLQRINGNVFPDPAAVILNAAAVAEYLEKTGESHRTISYLKNDEGEYYTVDSGGGFWRAYRYIPHSCCFKKPSGARNFRLVGEAFGGFLNALSGFDAALLRDTGRFHDTATRYRHFEASVKEDREGRAHEVQREIDFCVSRKKTAGVYSEGGELPRMRVIHGDTKISNVLFDTETGLPRAVIDLDTVSPGYAADDFGDCARSGANTAVEDSPEPETAEFDLAMFRGFAEGFLSECGQTLTDMEIEVFPYGPLRVSYELGMRFLTDYLDGDVYFKTNRPRQNLDRARVQFNLLSDMERKIDSVKRIIASAL